MCTPEPVENPRDFSQNTTILEKYPKLLALREHLIKNGVDFKANDNISAWITEEIQEEMMRATEDACANLFNVLMIDVKNDHNTKDTPHRMAKMFLNETMVGRYEELPRITEFPNASNLDQMIMVRSIRVESMCSHHIQNIRGVCHIAVMPKEDGKVIGLSKFSRLVNHIARRPQIQEELTSQIADALEDLLECEGIAVVVRAEHQCMSVRGVEEPDADTITSVMRGCYRENPTYKDEFFRLLGDKL
ncbi:GTP cyclohydrolase I type 1 [Vibrio phage vB_VcorM_GR7B]|nr:GTP cyclohydrolase I type 1 [Vibrio phage vB_VcorM_GR7B]